MQRASCAGQTSPGPCSGRLVTISTSGLELTNSATRMNAAREPVSAQCQSSISTTSERTARQHADERRQGVEQRRLEMFAVQMSRKRVASLAHREQMQEERQERLERCVERANPAMTTSAFRQRRPEIEGRAQNLHEDAVGNAVAVGPASRLQHAHAGAVGETLLQLVQQPALARARFADHRDCRSPTARGAGDMGEGPAMLESHVTRAASGRGAAIAVVGEAGAGKSRLLYELQERLADATDVRVLQARCRAYGDGVPYGVFVQILCAAVGLRPPLGNADGVIARIRAVDASLEPFLPLFLHLLSVTSDRYALPRHLQGEHLQAALLDALATMFGVLTARGSLVILIEDWHWADTGSRAAFLRIAELVGSSGLVLIVTSRLEQGPGDDWPASTRLHLERLDFDASVSIMQAILGVRAGVRRVSEAVVDDRAGGNPFFLEQMCAALLEQQAVSRREAETVSDGGEDALSLPETVQGVIRARLDNLDADALEIGRVASVIGAEFDHALLAEVVPPHVDLGSAIGALEAAGLVQRTTVASTIGYRFTHALTQEVCYDSLVGHQRKTLHGAIGHALASTHANRMDEWAARLAHHFRHAEDWPAAIRFGRRAAERAIAVSQFADALRTIDQALECVSRMPEREQSDLTADLLLQQERLCETLGLRARQQEIIDSLIAHLAREGSSARLAEIYLRQGDLSTLLKRFDAADRALGTALRIAHERGDTTLLRSGLRSLGLLRWHEGRHAEALDITRRALALDQECHDDAAVGVGLTNLGNILRATGDFAGARARLEEALAMPALREDPKKLVYTQHNLANVFRAAGDLDRALECLVESDEIACVHLLPIQRSFHLTSIAHIQLQRATSTPRSRPIAPRSI